MTINQGTREPFVTLLIQNTRDVAVTFCLEPWGEEYPMPHGATFRIVAHGRGWPLEVHHGHDRITLFAAEVEGIFHGQEELGAGLWKREAAPPTPPP